MSAPNPRVSIVIAAFNEEHNIADAVGSILSQDFAALEVIAVDDGSTDDTLKILGEFADNRLRVYRQDRGGQYPALVKGIDLAKGDLIARLDADDISLPGRISAQVAYMDANPDCAWVGCGEVRIDQKRNEHYTRIYPISDKEIRLMSARCIPYCHSGVMFRRSVVEHGLNYPLQNRFMNDFEFFIEVARRYKVANLKKAYVQRVVRDASYYQRNFSTFRQNLRLIRLSARAIRAFDLNVSNYRYLVFRFFYPLLPDRMKRAIRKVQGLSETQA